MEETGAGVSQLARPNRRASVVMLQCKNGLINLDRGGAVPDDLHLRGAVLPNTDSSPSFPHQRFHYDQTK